VVLVILTTNENTRDGPATGQFKIITVS